MTEISSIFLAWEVSHHAAEPLFLSGSLRTANFQQYVTNFAKRSTNNLLKLFGQASIATCALHESVTAFDRSCATATQILAVVRKTDTMLVASPITPPALMHDIVPDSDEDDEILQAVLLASLGQGSSESEGQCSSATQAQIDILSQCQPPPRVSTPVSLSSYAIEADLDEAAKQTLQALEDGPDHLKLVRVRGDGHCLFRAIAASLTLTAAWGGSRAFEALQSHLQSLSERCAQRVIASIRDMLGRNATEAANAAEFLNDEEKSDAAVAALRTCATDYMRQHVDRFRLCCDSGNLEEYCARMSEMSSESPTFSPAYGGHSEIVALSEALRIRVEIVDCR
eukprot:1499389-Pleurochrysis_carterae.AAC.7